MGQMGVVFVELQVLVVVVTLTRYRSFKQSLEIGRVRKEEEVGVDLVQL